MIKNSAYRLRVYTMPDSSLYEVFGNDDSQIPASGLLVSDHDITEIITVTDHPEVVPHP